MILNAKQTGYILLPVIVAITLVAAIALMMNTESALESNTASSELDAHQAQYVAEAGMNHALWRTQLQGCGPYTDLTDEPLGSDRYSSNLTTDLGATTSYSILVDQDAWIGSFQPSNNHGSDLSLHVSQSGGDSERALLRYDLSVLPAAASILSATAWFYVQAPHPDGSIEIHGLTIDWGEADATWDSMGAAMDSTILAMIPPQPTAGVWVSVNLTSQVQSWVNSEPNYGFALSADSEGVDGQYQALGATNPPYLEVIVGTPPTSPALLKATGTLANGVQRSINRNDVTLRQHPAGFSLSRVTTGSGKDAMLDSFYNNRDYGVHELEVSLGSGSTLENSLLQFELPSIAPGSRIISAQLELYHYVTARSTGTPVVEVHRVTRGWVEGTHDGTGTADGATWGTWDGSSNWTLAGGDYEALAAASSEISPATGDWEHWDISELVQGWIDEKYSNHGLILKGEGDFDISFASKEDADPALHPKLSITYTCACGEICQVPQGSGTILMVVIDPSTLVTEDQRAKDLFESWGYTVSVVSESANQTAYNAAIAAADVVFISETVNSIQVGNKLVAASIGVVSQDGDYNADLGLASGAVLKVGTDIDIVSTDHYITRPFAVGSLPIYSQAMEQLATSGGLTAGQQTLADIGGDGSLVTLEQGDAMEGGGTAAGRRVVLPLGTRYRFNWDYLNANGRVLVQRAIDWGMGKDLVSAGNLLLVVANAASPLTSESDRRSVIESLGYEVSLISDDAPQADFDTALADVDVVYVTGSGSSTEVGTKLTAATVGVLSEDIGLVDELGIAEPLFVKRNSQHINVIDNTHYVTTGFSLGALQLYSYLPGIWTVTGALAPGLQILGETQDGVSTYPPGLAFLETGAELYGGGFAAGRRVQMPWSEGSFDINQLNADGRTIFRRAIEWGASLASIPGPVAHWKLDETAGFSAVDSIGGHDGTLANGPAWTGGQQQGGLAFDGVDDVVDIGADTALDGLFGGKVTLTGWIYANGWGEGSYGRIADKSNATFPTAGWAFELYGPIQGLLFQSAFSGGMGGWSTPVASIELNTWHHVALVYDGSSDANDPEIYIDGVAQVVTESNAPAGSYVSDAANNFTIGNHSQATSRTFDGILDDIRLFDSLLSAAEIAELAILPGPLAHWKLDETSGPTAVDSEGGHDGTWTNGPAATTGVIDGGLDFDGSNDYVDAGTFDVTGSGITLMAWFNAEAIATDDGRIVSKASGQNEVDAFWQLSTTDSGSNRYLRMRIKASGTTTTFADSSVNLVADQWYFAVATYDNASGVMKLYLDGVEVASGAHALGGALDTDASVPVAIGANGTAERFFNGILDDVRVYDRALSATEINDLYVDGAPSPGSYTELYQTWSATSDGTWQTVTLGVPADAVVEVAVVNSDIGKEYFGGVRAVGSSLERRFQLHEAESGGVDAVTMHVQADASSQIQHYSDKASRVSFVLLGYWTGATYVERFDAFKAGANASWQSRDLGAYGVGANQVAEIAALQTSTSIEWLVGARQPGSSLNRLLPLHEAEDGGVDMVSMMAGTNASSMVEVYAEADSVVDFHLLGYWSTPPGTYTEIGGVHGQATLSSTWHTGNLTSFGIPANAIAQFVLSNERDSTENQMGLRETGSTINTRMLDLHEAEDGGGNLGTMHVRVDASSEIQWTAEYGASEGFFYPIGWWVLVP